MIIFCRILLAINLIFLCGEAYAAHYHHLKKEDQYEKSLIVRIRKIKQVKAYFAYNGKRAGIMIDKTPDSTSKTYYAVVGINHPDQFLVFWRFEIDPKTNKVTVEDDADTDDNIFIPLRLWQKWFYDSRFQKAHHFKYGQIYLTR